jgi:HemK-like putative methylase
MPRLRPDFLRHASRENVLLPLLLRECRDLVSARNELRWLNEHAVAVAKAKRSQDALVKGRKVRETVPGCRALLARFVDRRAKGEPLQYILGTQPFGDLEILCQKGILIPRPETEEYTTTLALLIKKYHGSNSTQAPRTLQVLDLCTGTGCISSLLHSLLRSPEVSQDGGSAIPHLNIIGVDISARALGLARRNLRHNVKLGLLHESALHEIKFLFADLLKDPPSALSHSEENPPTVNIPSVAEALLSAGPPSTWDIVISNPPYISPTQYAPGGSTARSVRKYEPKLALVPPSRPHLSSLPRPGRPEPEWPDHDAEPGDEFYHPILQLAKEAEAKVILLEVGDTLQAVRVARVAKGAFASSEGTLVEIWRDGGSVVGSGDRVGEDQGRAVVVWRGPWADWRRNGPSKVLGH